jgi:serine/threonine protein kinase
VRLPAEYTPDRVLGHGAYGLILHANTRATASRGRHGGAALPPCVAIKRLRPFHFDVDLKALLRELSVLRHVSLVAPHPNLIRLLDVCPPPPGPLHAWREVCLVVEAMDRDLHHILSSSQPLSHEHVHFFTLQVREGGREGGREGAREGGREGGREAHARRKRQRPGDRATDPPPPRAETGQSASQARRETRRARASAWRAQGGF